MVITTVLAFVVVRRLWKWNRFASGAVLLIFLTIDLAYLGANVVKIQHGGWFPLVIGAAIFTLMATWKRGREILFERLHTTAIALEPFLEGIAKYPPTRVPGTAVFMTAHADGVPHALLHNLNHNKVLHERVALLTVVTEDVPYVGDERRLTVQAMGNNFYRITIRYGFKDEPDIPKALLQCAEHGVECNLMETSFFLSRETLIASVAPGMAIWRERLFASMARNAGAAMTFFRIPTNRVVELGTQIEL
jgi:KUP system potassium uptake protein